MQPSQKSSAAKHSQYNLRHFDFLQLQGLRFDFDPGVVFSLPEDEVLTGVGIGPLGIGLGGGGYLDIWADMGVCLLDAEPVKIGVFLGWDAKALLAIAGVLEAALIGVLSDAR